MSDISTVAAVLGFAPGAIGGVCNVFVGHPIDLIKVRQQIAATTTTRTSLTGNILTAANRRSTTLSELRTIFAREGLVGLYRGVSAPLLAVTPAFAVSFWSFDVGKRAIREVTHNHEASLTTGQICLAGGFSGIPLAAVVGPSERLKCLMQVNTTQYSSFVDCARQVYMEGGLRSLFRGSGATLLRDVPGNAAYFGMYEVARRELCRWEGSAAPSLPATLLAGGMAGVANWIVAIPFDVIKSRYQTAPAGYYRDLFDVFQQLVRQEGVSALFRGLGPALLRAFPANAACLAGVETARSLLGSSSASS